MLIRPETPAATVVRIGALGGAGLCILLAIVLLLPWQEVELGPLFSRTKSGASGVGAVTLIAALALAAGHLLGLFPSPPLGRRPLGVAMIACAVAIPISAVLKLLDAGDYRTVWQWVGFLLALATAALGLLVGGVRTLLSEDEERLPFDHAVERVQALGRKGTGTWTSQRPAGQPPPRAAGPPQGWYPDPERPNDTRWWDGSAWGMTAEEYRRLRGERPPG
jgi:hypothetical protein